MEQTSPHPVTTPLIVHSCAICNRNIHDGVDIVRRHDKKTQTTFPYLCISCDNAIYRSDSNFDSTCQNLAASILEKKPVVYKDLVSLRGEAKAMAWDSDVVCSNCSESKGKVERRMIYKKEDFDPPLLCIPCDRAFYKGFHKGKYEYNLGEFH